MFATSPIGPAQICNTLITEQSTAYWLQTGTASSPSPHTLSRAEIIQALDETLGALHSSVDCGSTLAERRASYQAFHALIKALPSQDEQGKKFTFPEAQALLETAYFGAGESLIALKKPDTKALETEEFETGQNKGIRWLQNQARLLIGRYATRGEKASPTQQAASLYADQRLRAAAEESGDWWYTRMRRAPAATPICVEALKSLHLANRPAENSPFYFAGLNPVAKTAAKTFDDSTFQDSRNESLSRLKELILQPSLPTPEEEKERKLRIRILAKELIDKLPKIKNSKLSLEEARELLHMAYFGSGTEVIAQRRPNPLCAGDSSTIIFMAEADIRYAISEAAAKESRNPNERANEVYGDNEALRAAAVTTGDLWWQEKTNKYPRLDDSPPSKENPN
ncbi:MAG: hypothetical protein V4623_09620 [Pseudomonadota bacterium]